MSRSCRFLKVLLFIAILCAFVFGVSTAAGAWTEGRPPEAADGTHDWLILAANELAGQAGAGWVDVAAAQAVSHYPDEVFHDYLNHIYDVWGTLRMGTAPVAVKAHYALAVIYLKVGNYTAASQEVGLMAHYYDDVWNPWHTTYELSTLALQATYHVPYEDDVLGHEPDVALVPYDGYNRVRDAAAATRTAADISHNSFWALASAYVAGGYGSTGGTVDTITQGMLVQAANGLADLIASIKADARR